MEEGDDTLNIVDDEVDVWRREQDVPVEEEVHLFVGDSNGPGLIDAGLDVEPPDLIINRTEGGRKWQTLSIIIRRDINWWRQAASAFRGTLGVAVLWLTGNDYYPHPRRLSQPVTDPEHVELHVLQVLRYLRGVARKVLIVGPVPRYRFDRGSPWDRCPAYKAERMLLHMVHREGLGDFVQVLCVGRRFTVKVRSRRTVGDKCKSLFASDGIHLSPEGYAVVLRELPEWLRCGDVKK